MAQRNKCMTLKHLLIGAKKQIGLQYYKDKVLDALVDQLENVRWSQDFNMQYLSNNNKNIKHIYALFKGILYAIHLQLIYLKTV